MRNAHVTEFLDRPWPWYVAGPLIGLLVPALLLLGNRTFGNSNNLRHLCAAALPRGPEFFRYDWRRAGLWNLTFALGTIVGGFIAGVLFADPEPVAIAARTRTDLAAIGILDFSGLFPIELFSWASLATARGWIVIVGGCFLVGFGTAYGGGCTSGHGVLGLADRQLASLVACLSFFVTGILASRFLLPLIL